MPSDVERIAVLEKEVAVIKESQDRLRNHIGDLLKHKNEIESAKILSGFESLKTFKTTIETYGKTIVGVVGLVGIEGTYLFIKSFLNK